MIAQAIPDTSTQVSSSYRKELGEFRLAYSKAGSVTSMVLVLFGAGLDYATYPQHFASFFAARVLVALLTLGVLAVLYSSRGLRWVQPLTLLWLAIPQVMIAWMIYSTEGVMSIYFVGLHLALYAVGIILPLTLIEGAAFGLFTYLVYAIACYLHPEGLENMGRFVASSLFILFSSGASSVCTYFNERGRLQMFNLQRAVSVQNITLQDNNQALAQIKGHMIQQEKMAALGTLSAGLLHEVNNPVNYSLMALNMAMIDPAVGTSNDLKESLTDAKDGMQRVQRIVSDLKTFAYQKPGEDSDRIFLLERAVESALRLTGFEIKGIAIDVKLPQDTHVRGDEPAIIGVLINLFGNAALALNKAGKENPRIDVFGEHANSRLHIHVRDNGTGIKPENITRVFEPFFTTRDVGQGLGLGLSVSYAIVQRHGGELLAESVEGEWTMFSFDLAAATSQG